MMSTDSKYSPYDALNILVSSYLIISLLFIKKCSLHNIYV